MLESFSVLATSAKTTSTDEWISEIEDMESRDRELIERFSDDRLCLITSLFGPSQMAVHS